MNIYDDFFAGISPEDWEYFAADFLSLLGFLLLSMPSRGPDGGVDFKVSLGGVRFVVSCRHLLESGRAVGVDDEPSILDRISQHGAEGFIGFYSTQVSAALSSRFEAFKAEGRQIYI